jgi:murein DD-endopeptidase MepM/ murein hydrolase activator NlpD
MRHLRVLVPLILLLAPVAASTHAAPRADAKIISVVNQRAPFQAMLERVEPLVITLGKAKDDAAKKAAEDRLFTEFGKSGIEILVRYREPHLIPVFARLTESDDWSVRRLAIFGLQRNLAVSGLDLIVARLADENPLVREIAATTISILHFAGRKHRKLMPRTKPEKVAQKGLGSRKKADLKALRAAREKEENAYVENSLTAAIEVMGKRPLILIHEEQLVGKAPARRVPRTEGGQVNAYQKGSGYMGSGSGRLKPTKGWGYPTLLYPKEIMNIGSDAPLVPLVKKAKSLHFGHDCGWFLEGSSIYAIADGVVRMVKSGGDWGGLIVLEYLTEDRKKIVGLNGHCGMWVFAKPGEAVKRGQVVGVMALSFSPENGGHGAHDHFGMFTGAFSEGRCFGRSGAGRSIEGWLKPPEFLTPRVEGKNVPPDSYK